MDMNSLEVMASSIGGYFSSEQIDLLSIIEAKNNEELLYFIMTTDQMKNVYSKEDLELLATLPLEDLKRAIFKSYQDTMVYRDDDNKIEMDNRLKHLNLKERDLEVIKNVLASNTPGITSWLKDYLKTKYPKNFEDIIDTNHHFMSRELDNLKDKDLYEDMSLLDNNLDYFDTMLIGSGRIYKIINQFYDNDKKYDFYYPKRDLDFAYRNQKNVRYHSLLVRESQDLFFKGMPKEEVLSTMKGYVKASIDFINNYNDNHKINVNGTEKPVVNAVDLFNEIVSFDKDEKGEYYNIWEKNFGITIDDLLEVFDYAFINKKEGMSYLYNEPFLEDTKRRKKVFEVLGEIDKKRLGLIDTLGTQMHITLGEDENNIKEVFADFKNLQDQTGKKIEITEFDMSLGREEVPKVLGENPEVKLEEVYDYKKQKIKDISSIINNSGVNLSGLSYWSLTDKIDFNLPRIRSNYLKEGLIKDINQIPTVCGGLFPTYKKLIKQQNHQLTESVNKTI